MRRFLSGRSGGFCRSFLVCLAILWMLPQNGLAQLQLGPISLSQSRSNPSKLDNPTALAEGLGSHAFLGSVGGVAFGAVAEGLNGLTVSGLDYVDSAADGKRLRVTLKPRTGAERTVTADIYDWQLVPIAQFAAGEQHACFTLFGKLMDENEQEARLERGERILNYHEAFENTLMGLRLFQADILILRPEACELPSTNGVPILGAGEGPPNVTANRLALSKLHDSLSKLTANEPFQSYVICDFKQDVKFGMKRAELTFTGIPIWYCWKTKPLPQGESERIQAAANATANEILNVEFNNDQNKMERADFLAKWTPEYQKSRHSKLFDQIISPKLIMPLLKHTNLISNEVPRQGGVNPAVYNSLVTTMRYSALFRAYKAEHPAEYTAFVESLKDVPVNPEVETPSVMIEPPPN